MDPLSQSFAWWTPYQFAGNTPIAAIDLDGAETLVRTNAPTRFQPSIYQPSMRDIARQAFNNAASNGGSRSGFSGWSPGTQAKIGGAPQYMENQWGERTYLLPPIFRINPIYNEKFSNKPVSAQQYEGTTPATLHQSGESSTFFSYDQYLKEFDYQKTNAKESEDNEDGSRYTLYITIRNQKQIGGVADKPLVYTGIFKGNDPSNRYNLTDIELENMQIITSDLTKDQAKGAEQLLIELNNGNVPYPSNSKTLDNFRNSTDPNRTDVYNRRKTAGEAALNTVNLNWRKDFKRPDPKPR